MSSYISKNKRKTPLLHSLLPTPHSPLFNTIWLQWLFVTFIGFLASLFWIEIGEKPDIGGLQGLVGGAMIGLAQLLVLRRYISQAGWWILASSLSWSFIGLSPLGAMGWVAPRMLEIIPRLLYGIVGGGIIGMLLGVGQWLVLRQHISKAWQWIFVNTLSWSIALALGWIIGGILRLVTRLFISEVIGLTVTWILVGAMTGLALIKFLENPKPRK